MTSGSQRNLTKPIIPVQDRKAPEPQQLQFVRDIMWYVGGDRSKKPSSEIFVGLPRCGLPSFIPPQYQKLMRTAPNSRISQYVLTICGLSRVILEWQKGPRTPFETIYVPGYRPGKPVRDLCLEIFSGIPVMFRLTSCRLSQTARPLLNRPRNWT